MVTDEQGGRERRPGLEPGDNWAPLALVDGKLLVRGQKELKVLQVAR
jgi:hypothetical protein